MDVRFFHNVLAAGLLAALAASCGDAPKLSEIETEVFAKSCAFSTCHKGASPAGGLALDGPAYENLVGVAATGAPGKKRVVPGDPDNSYIVEKMTKAKPQSGEQMPPTAPLSDEKIEMIRAWIEAGAEND